MQIRLVDINFEEDRVVIEVKNEGCLTNDERNSFTELLLKKYPEITGQSCRNSKGPTFGDCVKTTSIAHILEHVILSELAKNSTRKLSSVALRSTSNKPADSSASLFFPTTGSEVYLGKTTKLSEEVAKIELNYYDDILTLQAITRATAELNDLLNACKEKDI